MKNQYCKVGATTPIASKTMSLTILEYQYQLFLEKSSQLKYSDDKLKEFFELKALKLKRILENVA